MNGDGKIDLIERTSAGLSVELGNGDGTFGGAIPIAAPVGSSLLLADFNGDGSLDIASASAAGTVSVMTNDNSGITGIVATANLTLSAPTSTVAGAIVTVTDLAGNIKTDFTEMVSLATSDPRSPGLTYTFTAADAGTHSFATGMRLVTDGAQSIVATSSFLTTSSQAITVAAGPVARVAITTPASTVAGSSISFTLAALDAFGNMGAAYTGTVHFSSSDVQAGLPADYTFTPADAGIHHFTAVLKSAGFRTITAADTLTPTVSGSVTSIYVTPLAVSALSVVGGAGSIGVFRPVTGTATDIYGNLGSGYNRVVHFASTDPLTLLPANAALVNGV